MIAITIGSFSPLFYLVLGGDDSSLQCGSRMRRDSELLFKSIPRAYPPTWLPASSIIYGRIYGCNSMTRNMAEPSYQSGELARRIQLPRTQTRRAPRSSFVPLKWENRNR